MGAPGRCRGPGAPGALRRSRAVTATAAVLLAGCGNGMADQPARDPPRSGRDGRLRRRWAGLQLGSRWPGRASRRCGVTPA